MVRSGKEEKEVIVITGANNGIGFHMAVKLLEDKYRVAVLDLSDENLIELYKTFQRNLKFFRCDVSNDSDVSDAVNSVIQEWGRIDVLVNNACICIFSPFEERSKEQTRREFEVNYFGYIRMIDAVLPHMKAQGRGIIHNFSSGVGITGFSGISGYASTKGAIEALTRTLSFELAPYGIHVNLIHPPLTNTKSASPLDIPSQAMADPSKIGRKLAGKILSTKPVIAPNFQTVLYLFFARNFPNAIGKLFSKLTENERKKHQ